MALPEETVRIEKVVLGGQGLGRLADGRALFVTGALPGDVIRLHAVVLRKSFAEAQSWTLEQPSPRRTPARCADAERCGGCGLMALPLQEQQALKLEQLRDTLMRLGGLGDQPVLRQIELLAGQPFEYRSRIRLRIQGRALGFLREASHELVSVQRCHLVSDALWQGVAALQEALARAPLLACESVEVRLLPGARTPSAYFFWAPEAARRDPFLAALAEVRRHGEGSLLIHSSAAPSRVEDWDEVPLSDDLFGLVPPGGFVQVNAAVNRQLVERLIAATTGRALSSALDLYCGFGNFSLVLAGRGLEVLGVDTQGPAIDAARVAAARQGLSARFQAADARHFLARLAREGRGYDLVVVDPPRAGGKGMADDLRRVCRQLLLMVSCDPATLARDVAALCRVGFELESVCALDMFPQTHHLETLCILLPPRT